MEAKPASSLIILVSFNRSDLIAEQGSNRSQNGQESQNLESTLSSPEVVPHLAPKKFEKKVLRMGREYIQKYSHIKNYPFWAI